MGKGQEDGCAMKSKSEPLYLVLEGHNHVLRPDAFVDAVQGFVRFLREMDASVSNNPRGTVAWEIVSLTKSSPAVVGFKATPRKTREPRRDYSEAIRQDVVVGLDLLSKRPERLRTYTDRALDRTEYLAKLRSNDRFDEVRVLADKADVNVGISTLANIQIIKGPTYESAGSVVGMLEQISVHRSFEFRIWSETTGKPVTCRFGEEMFDQVKEALRRRVAVHGLVKWNALGHPISVVVEGMKTLEPEREMTIEEVSGAVEDFTGGLSLEDYLEELRNG